MVYTTQDKHFFILLLKYLLFFKHIFSGSLFEMTGVEPVSYYLKNGILNFNIVFILALLSPLAVEVQVYTIFIHPVGISIPINREVLFSQFCIWVSFSPGAQGSVADSTEQRRIICGHSQDCHVCLPGEW